MAISKKASLVLTDLFFSALIISILGVMLICAITGEDPRLNDRDCYTDMKCQEMYGGDGYGPLPFPDDEVVDKEAYDLDVAEGRQR